MKICPWLQIHQTKTCIAKFLRLLLGTLRYVEWCWRYLGANDGWHTGNLTSQTESMFQGSLAKTSVFGWSESERACCLRRKPIRKSLVRLLSEVAVCGCLEKHVEGTEKRMFADCQSPLKLFRAVVSPKVFPGAAAWVKRHSHVEYESMKSKIRWEQFYKENRTNILLCKLQQIFPVKMQWQPRQEFQAQDPGPREYTPWPRVAKLVSLYTIYSVISADPGLRQGRGGAWDHRRCGSCLSWTLATPTLQANATTRPPQWLKSTPRPQQWLLL